MKRFLKLFFIVGLFASCCAKICATDQTIGVPAPITHADHQTACEKSEAFVVKPNVTKVFKGVVVVAGLAMLVVAYVGYCNNNAALEKECRDAVRIRIAKLFPKLTPDESSEALNLGTQRCISKFYHFDYSFISDMKIRIKSLLHDEYGTFQWGWQNGEPLPW